MKFSEDLLTNSQIAELLAIAAEDAPAPLNRAYRRASRKALLWPVEVFALTELPGVGPYLNKVISRWIELSPDIAKPPAIRANFFTLTEARAILRKDLSWARNVKASTSPQGPKFRGVPPPICCFHSPAIAGQQTFAPPSSVVSRLMPAEPLWQTSRIVSASVWRTVRGVSASAFARTNSAPFSF